MDSYIVMIMAGSIELRHNAVLSQSIWTDEVSGNAARELRKNLMNSYTEAELVDPQIWTAS